MLNGYHIAAVCASKIHEDTMCCFIDALNKALVKHNWRVFVYTTASDLYWKRKSDIGEATVFDLIDYNIVDALIVLGNKILDDAVIDKICARAKRSSVPVAMIEKSGSKGCYNINFDYRKGFEQIVRHLVEEHDVKKIHYIGGFEGNDFSEERLNVIKALLAEYNIPFDDSMVSYGNFWSVPSIQAAEKIIESGNIPEAIVCANDLMAVSVCNTFIKHGYKVPEDVRITGFDGIDAIRFSLPKITSAMCDFAELAEKTAETILDIFSNKSVPESVNIMPRLIASESCGCSSADSEDASGYINGLNDTFNRFQNESRVLNEISALIQRCHSMEEVISYLKRSVFYNMCCILKKECIDPTLNPLSIHSSSTFGENMYVLLDADVDTDIKNRNLKIGEIIPRLDSILESAVPLIFKSLNSLDIPLGYLCFYYGKTEKTHLLQISQIAAALNNGIGGYRSLQHQQYLRTMVEDMYKFDTLTGLFNRNGFLRKYEEYVKSSESDELTLVLCDLNGLKYINDNYSHHEGDNAIFIVAEALRSVCGKGLCSRYGGDEMIAVMTTPCDTDEIKKGIEAYIDRYNRTSGKPYTVSASIGIHVSYDNDFEKMFSAADELMYLDKARKKNRRR